MNFQKVDNTWKSVAGYYEKTSGSWIQITEAAFEVRLATDTLLMYGGNIDSAYKFLTIGGSPNIIGESGSFTAICDNVINVTSESVWSIVSGSNYGTIAANGIVILDPSASGSAMTIQAEFGNLSATKDIIVTYRTGSTSHTDTEVVVDPDTGTTTTTTTTTTTNEDGTTSSETTSTTYDSNGDPVGSSENTTTTNPDGSSTSSTTNYDANGDPTTGENVVVDPIGNVDTQTIEYDEEGEPTVTGYTIDTTESGGEGKQIVDGVNTEYYAFDTTRGFILDFDFVIDFANQPPNQDENHHNILTAKRATPAPWYGFQLRQSNNNKYIILGTQFATGNNINTELRPNQLVGNVAEYNLRIKYDPTATSNRFICWDMSTGNVLFSSDSTFPNIEELKYLTITIGCAQDVNGDPFRYSNITVKNFSIEKLPEPVIVSDPVITCNGRQITISCETPGAVIFYKLNQTGLFQEYSNPISISDDTIVEAYADLTGYTSNTVIETCIFSGLKNPAILCSGTEITITCATLGAQIYYKLDHASTYELYLSPISISADTFVEAYAELEGDTSDVVSETCYYSPVHDYSFDYLTLRILSNGTVAWNSIGSGQAKSIQYSINGGSWITILASSSTTISVSEGDVVRLKGTNSSYSKDKSNYSGFEGGTAEFNVEGNIMSLIYGDNFVGQTTLPTKYNFCSLFKLAKVISAKNLILPAETLTEGCYRAMFSKCSYLIEAPETLTATVLAKDCCWYMFEECSFEKAPLLPASTLVQTCYGWMFTKCPNLNYIKCLATSGFNTTNCLQSWANNVAATGTFVKADTAPTGSNGWKVNNIAGIPTGWTVVNASEEPDPEHEEEYDGPVPALLPFKYSNQEVTLPYSINAVDGHSSAYAKGSFNFTSKIYLDEDQPTYLQFEHADQSTDIYIDGNKVTTHWGGYGAFTTDITNYVHSGSNELRLILNNTTRNSLAPAAGDFNFNATLGDVHLITAPILPAVTYGYDGFHVSASVSSASASVVIKTSIPTTGRVVCTIDDGISHWSGEQTGSGDIVFNVVVQNPHLWDGVNDPHLYDITLDIYSGEDLCYTSTRPFGFRYFSYVTNDTTVIPNESYTGFLLNGHPYCLRGVCMHQDIEGKANALSSADIAHDFDIIQELGANFIRTAHYNHPREFYDWCDRRGIIVETEVPWVNKAQTTMPEEYYTHLESQVTDMVTQHYNHPSIIFWGLANEITTDDKAFAKTKIDGYVNIIRSYDTSRLIGYVVSHGLPNGLGAFNNPNVDWIGQNIYVGWYLDQNSNNPTSRINTCLNNASTYGKPVAYSEYGCGGTQNCHSEDFMTTTTRGNNPRHDIEYMMWLHEGQIAAIRNFPQLLFTSQWVLFDFAVSSRSEGYTICLDGETTSTRESLKRLNDKGLVERDHVTKKDPFYLYKAWWNPNSKFVHICGKDYTKQVSRTIKCYTNDANNGKLALYVNDTFVEEANVTDNIATFTPMTFSSGDVVRVEGSISNDTHTF